MIGQFAVSKAGHDKGTLYVVVAREGDFVYLSEGRLKTPQKPKKKRLRPIQPQWKENSCTGSWRAGRCMRKKSGML